MHNPFMALRLIEGSFFLISLVVSALFLLPGILYALTLQKTLNKCTTVPRAMEPGLVWLLLIPGFDLIWHFFVVIALAKSLKSEYAKRGIPTVEEAPAQGVGLAMCICACCTLMPLWDFLVLPAFIVLWIIYWVKIASYSRLLDEPQAQVQAMPTA